jgi:hypothetical protein
MFNFKDVDKGYDAMKKRAESIKNRRVTVGIHAKDDGRTGSEDKTTNLQVGTAHEFGATIHHPGGTPYKVVKDLDGTTRAVFLKKGDPTATWVTAPHVIELPERSFLRATLDEKGPEYVKLCREFSIKVLEGQMSIDRAMGLLGARIKADVVQRFNDNRIRPDISADTKRRKGSSTVLIDTGSLKQSIDYLVRSLFESQGLINGG